MPFFTTNDQVKVNYHRYGEPENPVIIFIGGYSSSEITWHFQIEPFVAAGYQVITYDHRGHGASDKVSYGLTLQRLGFDLHELMVALELQNVVLVGHSMGAATILAYEQLFGDGNLRAVVTEDQSPTFLQTPDWLDGYGRSLGELEQFMTDFPRTKLTQQKLSDETKRILGRGMLPFDFQHYRPLLLNIITQDLRPVIRREKVPHLFLAGGASPVFSPAHAAAARALQQNPLSTVEQFAGCGHILHLEAISKFNETLLSFLKKL